MRPRRLTVSGLRSFRSEVAVEFDGRNHVAIVGDTGAGKSSLLEAMTWALYGRTSWSGQPNQELMNDTSTSLRVILRFDVRGQTWQVTRSLRRAGDGTVGATRVSLVRDDDGDGPIEQIEQVGPVGERVEELLGLDHEAFTRTVILPQGQFARLLVTDRATERARILRQVWRLDELEAVGEAARRSLEEMRPLAARLEEVLAGLPDDPDAALRDAQADAALRAERAAATATLRADVAEQVRVLEEAAAHTALLDRAVAAVPEEWSGLAHQAEAVAETAARLRSAAREVEVAQADVAARLAAVPSDRDGRSSATVAQVRATLAEVERLAADVGSARRAAAAAREDAAAAEREAAQATEKAQRCGAALQTAEESRVALAERAAAAAARLDEATRRLDALRSERAALADVTGEHARITEALTSARRDHDRASALLADATDAVREATERLAEARRADAAATAAHGHTSGDPCPVCDRALPDGWAPPPSPALDDADSALRAAEATAADAARAERAAQAVLAQAEAAVDQQARQRAAAEQRLAAARNALEELIGTSLPSEPGPDVAVLTTLQEAAAEARGALAQHDAVLAEQRAAADVARQAAAARQEAARQLAGRREHETRRAEELAARLREVVEAVPRDLEVELEEPTEESVEPRVLGLADASAVLDHRQRVLDERARDRTRLGTELAELNQRLEQQRARWRAEVGGAVADLRRSLDAALDAVVTAAARLDVEVDVAGVRGDDEEPESLPDRVPRLTAAAADVRATAAERREALQQQATAARAALASSARTLDADAGDPHAVLQAAAEADDDARVAARRASDEAAATAALVEPLRRALAAQQRLVASMRAVGDLAAAMKDGAFPRWLTLRRSRALLVHASRQLRDMTDGRYAFADLSDEGAEWLVVDNDSGQPRSPASLSGGEQFVASLALALGMVEMVGRSGGRLGSLWLDEGFGALDRTNLDAAVEALAGVAAGGRLVGVVSHVRGVAERVDDVLAVTRTATGSTARWLTPAERGATGRLTDGDELTSALGGLLD